MNTKGKATPDTTTPQVPISLLADIKFKTGPPSNQQDALDLAQETFVRVFEHRAGYEPRSKFSTWLFTIATNLCRNQARWRERHPTVTLHGSGGDDDPGLEDTMPASGDSPADSAERSDLASTVREHIQELPHDLRTVVLLFEYQELGYEEIAGALHCSPKAERHGSIAPAKSSAKLCRAGSSEYARPVTLSHVRTYESRRSSRLLLIGPEESPKIVGYPAA